jgi:hypothetical protein
VVGECVKKFVSNLLFEKREIYVRARGAKKLGNNSVGMILASGTVGGAASQAPYGDFDAEYSVLSSERCEVGGWQMDGVVFLGLLHCWVCGVLPRTLPYVVR